MPDTIVALITGPPPSAVAVIRLSGPDAYVIASRVFIGWPSTPEPRHALFGKFVHGDEGLALPFPEGHSFTGEESVELSVHGGRASVTALLQACETAGARPARPGEFTLRAFMSGRMDLSQAEAVADTVEAETARQLEAANRNRGGSLSSAVGDLCERILTLLAGIEASIDFSEEIGEPDFEDVAGQCVLLAADLRGLIATGRRLHLEREGRRIALVGRPNAGKSSLMNALLGKDRSIVTDVPGTTRDTVEESLDFHGVKLVLIDTAGLRPTTDEVESLGVERTLRAAEEAHEVWYIYDASQGWTSEDEGLLEGLSSAVVIGNKADLAPPKRGIPVSALTGEGLESLASLVASTSDEQAPTVNVRQEAALGLALEAIEACGTAAAALHPPDLLSVLLQDALSYLGRVTGETASPDVIEQIFSRFCIGK